MIPLGLSTEDRAKFEAALSAPRVRRRTIAQVFDQNERPVASLPLGDRLLAGEVTVDATATPTHKLSLTLADPNGEIPYDLNLDDAVSLKHFVGVKWGVNVPDLGWIDVPVFFGPVRKYTRFGAEVTIECDGKEMLATDAHRLGGGPLTLAPSRRVRGAIRQLLERRGERKFRFSAPNDRLGEKTVYSALADPWVEAKDLAREIDRDLFYDGEGFLRLRRRPQAVQFRFRTGEGGTVLSAVETSLDDSEFANVVRVRWEGGHVTQRANAGHPLSPASLSRRGNTREVWYIEDTRIKNQARAVRRATNLLTRRSRIEGSATFEALPVPHLEPMDLCSVTTSEGTFNFRLRQFTLPLVPGPMTINDNRDLFYRIRKRRTRRVRKRR